MRARDAAARRTSDRDRFTPSQILPHARARSTFKVKKGTVLKKVFDAYHAKMGTASGTLRFVLEGTNLDETMTVKMAEIDEGSVIDALAQQTGGGRS